MGLDPQSASGANGASGDPDDDGQTNLAEYIARTHPRGTFTRYLAEGATSTFFITTIGLANPSATQAAHAWLRFQKSDGTEVPLGVEVPPLQARMVTVNTLAGLEDAAFATVVESDAALAVHRTMTWDPGRGYGSHLETAVAGAGAAVVSGGGVDAGGVPAVLPDPEPGHDGRRRGGAIPAAERGAGGEDVHGAGAVAVQRVGEQDSGNGEHGLLGGGDGDHRGADHRGAGDVPGRGGRARVRGGARERGGDGAGVDVVPGGGGDGAVLRPVRAGGEPRGDGGGVGGDVPAAGRDRRW